MILFSGHFNLHKPIQIVQIVFFENFENCRSPFKMKPCTRRVPKIGKKTLEICMYNILIIKSKQLLVHI
jgi:hypothetical protein